MTGSQAEQSTAQQNPDARADAGVTNLRARSRRSRGRRTRVHRHIPMFTGLVGVLLLAFLVILFGAIKIASLSTTADVLQVALEESEAKLADTRSELAHAERQLEAAVQGRFPQLRRLEFDKVLPVHEGYVKNILFTLLKKPNKQNYEYKIVMENDTDFKTEPVVKILMFDNLGVQLGVDEVPHKQPLLRGEIRSYSSVIELLVPGEPAYFYVVTE